jgi:hypothetical protein
MAKFVGSAYALSSAGLARAASALGVGAAELWAVMATETGGCGYLRDRRPRILYERHIFRQLTDGRFRDPDVSCGEPGGYRGGAAEYERLAKAMSFDASAALKSASWGLGQILGENYDASGFESVDGMVAAMTESEDAQLLAFAQYLKSRKLDQALQARDWQAFALKYNGPNYARYKYDEKLIANYTKYSSGKLPDMELRAAQLYLTYSGYDAGPIDGLAGSSTADALSSFQRCSGLNVTGKINDETLKALERTLT